MIERGHELSSKACIDFLARISGVIKCAAELMTQNLYATIPPKKGGGILDDTRGLQDSANIAASIKV